MGSNFWKRAIFGAAIFVVFAVVSLLAFFKIVQHRIASHLAPPVLQRESPAVPDLPYRTLDGTLRRVSASKGKVVFLDLWGTWCIQCVAEMPTVQKLYSHYRNDSQVEFLIVSRLDSSWEVRSYASRNHLDLPFYITHDEDVPGTMYLGQFPATFIYAKDGSIAAHHAGASDWSDKSVISFIELLKAQ
jgi:thiol-disulfide isomerase/thioredoxin